jgi:Ca-activated chloride channel family protein
MTLRGKAMEIVAEIKEKEAARKIYQQAQQSGRRAALIEQHRPNIFTTDVANLAPGDSIEVEIDYLQLVRYDQGRFHLRFPMVVAPRYSPPSPVQLVDTPANGTPATGNPDQPPPETPVLHPDEGKLNPVRLRVRLDAGVQLASLKSPHHGIVASDWQEGQSEISLADGVVPADRDFELVWEPAVGAQPAVALFQETLEAETFVLAVVLPPAADQAPSVLPRDVVFVLDRSGSMAGASIRQARAALVFALGRLTPQDRFNILRFANQTESLFDGLRPVSPESRALAVRYVEQTEAGGGTNMRPALLAALAGDAAAGRLRQVVFLTDAAVGNEAALFDEIAARTGDNRLFTVGIGSAPNSYFMQRAAELGRGSFTYIGNTEDVGEKMRALFRKIERPMATGLAATWQGLPEGTHRIDAYPGRLPDLYDGEPVMLAARISGPEVPLQNAALTVSGTVGGAPWQRRIALTDARPATGAATLWGRARIRALMMSLHRGADANSVRRAVTATALRHHIVSRYTSLVAAEKAISRPTDEPVFPRDVPRNLPDGWVFEKVFGDVLKTRAASRVPALAPDMGATPLPVAQEARLRQATDSVVHRSAAPRAAAPAAAQGQPVRLPAGSTAAPLHLLLGILMLLIAVILLRRARPA